MFNFFTPLKPIQCKNVEIDLSSLDSSFRLLQDTTTEVSHAAVEAAKVLQERLTQSENRFFNTVNNIEDLVLIKNYKGQWLYLNQFGQNLLSLTPNQYLQKTNRNMKRELKTFERVLDDECVTDQRAWQARIPIRYEVKVLISDVIRYFDVIKTPIFDENNLPKELIIIGRDITKIREQSLRQGACFQALNSASHPITIVDSRGNIVFCNDVFVDLVGCENYCQLLHVALSDIIAGINVYSDMWTNVQKNYLFVHNGINMSLNVSPVMNGQINPIFYICTFKNTF